MHCSAFGILAFTFLPFCFDSLDIYNMLHIHSRFIQRASAKVVITIAIPKQQELHQDSGISACMSKNVARTLIFCLLMLLSALPIHWPHIEVRYPNSIHCMCC
jgi:hypothetical protein